jgi:hypothetical protein
VQSDERAIDNQRQCRGKDDQAVAKARRDQKIEHGRFLMDLIDQLGAASDDAIALSDASCY